MGHYLVGKCPHHLQNNGKWMVEHRILDFIVMSCIYCSFNSVQTANTIAVNTAPGHNSPITMINSGTRALLQILLSFPPSNIHWSITNQAKSAVITEHDFAAVIFSVLLAPVKPFHSCSLNKGLCSTVLQTTVYQPSYRSRGNIDTVVIS